MGKIDINSRIKGIPATQELIDSLKGHIRKADKEEVWASSHEDINMALDLSFRAAEVCFIGLLDDNPMIAFGVVRPFLLSANGIIWMLATDDIEKRISKTALARRCREYISTMLQSFDLLYNFVDVRNTVTVKWLEWIGAEFDEPKPYGPDNMLFRKFYIRRNK